MNLHQLVSSAIGAVNPNQFVELRQGIGNTKAPDGTTQPAYATPGSITASIGGTFQASCDETGILTVISVITGSLQSGDIISGTDGINAIPAGCAIIDQIFGPAGGAGTYQLNMVPFPGALAQCDVTALSTVLNASDVASGKLAIGQTLADTTSALAVGTMITGQISGPTGGAGLYSLTQQQTVASEAMTTSLTILAQIQAQSASDLRHTDYLNLQGSHRVLYASLDIKGIVRVTLRGGDLVVLPDGSVWLVEQPVEPWFSSAGWVKILITAQDGS